MTIDSEELILICSIEKKFKNILQQIFMVMFDKSDGMLFTDFRLLFQRQSLWRSTTQFQ